MHPGFRRTTHLAHQRPKPQALRHVVNRGQRPQQPHQALQAQRRERGVSGQGVSCEEDLPLVRLGFQARIGSRQAGKKVRNWCSSWSRHVTSGTRACSVSGHNPYVELHTVRCGLHDPYAVQRMQKASRRVGNVPDGAPCDVPPHHCLQSRRCPTAFPRPPPPAPPPPPGRRQPGVRAPPPTGTASTAAWCTEQGGEWAHRA